MSDDATAQRSRLRTLLRTVESVYATVGVLAGVVLFALAPVIVTHWVKPVQMPVGEIERAVRLMGIAIACTWMTPLYSGTLNGLHAQVELNMLLAAGALLRWGGGALVLLSGWSSAGDFFAWQIVAGLVQSIGLFVLAWRMMPGSGADFRWEALREIWRFAAGVAAASVVGILIAQADKVTLSKLVPLGEFGQYMLASQFATALAFFAAPIFAAVFPHFTRLMAMGERDVLCKHFHQTSQLLAVLVLPWAFTLSTLAGPLLKLWGRGADVSTAIALLPYLAAGTALNIMINPPYTLQLAMGRTRAVVLINTVALVLFVPLLLALIAAQGVRGGALAWLSLNIGYLVVGAPLMMARALPGQLARWYAVDIALPAVVALAVSAAVRLYVPPSSAALAALACALSVLGGTAAAALAAPATRPRVIAVMRRLREGSMIDGKRD